jgi:hypothetical protein
VRVALALVVLVAAGVVYLHGPRLRQRVVFLRLQRDCLQYVAPPGTVAFSDDPEEAKVLLQRPDYCAVSIFETHPLSPQWQPPAGFIPPPATALPKTFDYPHSLFLHGLRTASGAEYLVSAHVWLNGDEEFHFVKIIVEVKRPVELFGSPESLVNVASGLHGFDLRRGDSIRFYFGEVSPVDPSRFRIPFEMNGQRGVVEGHLGEDGSVALTQTANP